MKPPSREQVAKARRRLGPYVGPGLLIAAVVVVAALAMIQAVDWLGRPFAGFFAYSSGLVSPMQRSQWPGRRAGMRPADQVVTVDGVPFSDQVRLRRHLEGRPLGASLRVEVLRGGTPRVLHLKVSEFTSEDVLVTLATPFSIGIIYLLMGTVIFLFRPTAPAARLTLVLLSLISLFYLTTFSANTDWSLERLWIGYPLFGAVGVHLFTVFPEEWEPARRHRWIRIIPYAMAGLLVLLRQIFLGAAEGTTTLAYASTAFVTLVTLANIGLLGLQWRQTDSQLVVRKVKVLLVAILATSTLGVIWAYAARIDPEAITWDLAMLFSAPFPILLGYAVLKHNIFDVDVVLRTTSIYVLSTGLVLALYFMVVAFFTLLTQEYLPFYEATPAAVIATLAVAVAFNPLRVAVQRVLSRLFFREKYDLTKTVAELTQQVSKVTDVSSLARVLTQRLGRLLRVNATWLLVSEQASSSLVVAQAAGTPGSGAPDVRFAIDGRLATLMRARGRPRRARDLIEQDRLPADEGERLQTLEARLVVPLRSRETLVGVLLVGGRGFDDVFTPQDLELLETLQVPLAIALQNAVLFTERAQQERLAALGQVASIIIHEVKNPLGIINVSIGTIKRRLQEDSSRELATLVEEEVERMNRTIAQILTFARPQQADLAPCDLNELVQRTLRFARPDIEAAGIELSAELDEGLGHVPADAEQLQQVLLNLLLNAKAALDKGGKVCVRTRTGSPWQARIGLGSRSVSLIVEDDGVGMDPDTRAKIFSPFFTTRRGGTGLGLAIVKQIVEAHRGEIRVESEPDQGSRFTILLPV